MSHGHRGFVQEASPFHEVLLHLPRAVAEVMARPDGVVLQIPAQFPGLDGTDGSDEPPALRAGDFALARRGRLIDEPGAGGSAADAVLLVELQVGEFEDEFLQRLGFGLGSGSGTSAGSRLPRATRIAFIAASTPPASLLTGM